MNARYLHVLVSCGLMQTAGIAAAQISEVRSFPIGDNWAQITWATKLNADAAVEYGLTDSYGLKAVDANSYVSHRLTLFDLKPRTTYHYRVRSTDSSGHSVASEDRTFATGDLVYGCESNPTGEPIGGGAGYSRVVKPADATVTVRTAAALLAAIASAKPGNIIYVEDGAAIDLSGSSNILIPGGVTIASGRGRDGSAGGLIFTTTFSSPNTPPLFRTNGSGIRITGVRMAGPSNSIGRTAPMYHGIYVAHYWTEIDNSEFWGFNYAAIETTAGTQGLYVHHCYFHHNTRTGVGYAVCPSQGVALIEGNLFDYHRHSIASSGQSPSGYEARYNLVMEHSVSHAFDMHGAADFEKAINVGIWRFDEGSGMKTADTSEYGRNDPAMFGFDESTCWVAGRLNSALQFDGRNDYVDCTAHANLSSKAFSVMGWIKPATVTGTQAIFSKAATTPTGDGYSLRLVDSALEAVVYDSTGAKVSTVTGKILPGSWSHVAITFSGSTACVYLNGTQSATFACNGVKPSPSHSLMIGRDSSAATSYFKGVIDEVRAYSSALPASEIRRNYDGNGDIAGDAVYVHHNTSRLTDRSQVVVRGRPAIGFWVDNNRFYGTGPQAIRQLNATGNLFVRDNQFGPTGHAPTLTWAGEPHFAGGGVSPQTGTSADVYTFRVRYADADDDPPMLGYPKLHLLRNGEEFTYFTPLTIMPVTTAAFSSGRTYFFTLMLPRGSDYTCYFEAYDAPGNKATGAATATQPGPTITAGNAAPVLYPAQNSQNYVENPVYPAHGTTDTQFDFRAVYEDIDNDPPQVGFPKVRLVDSNNADIPGSPFTMSPMTTTQYANGRHYQFLTKFPVGDYRCEIVARDSQGAKAVSIPARLYPVEVKAAGSSDVNPSTPMTPFDPTH